ncbi:hypothetical protein DV736_g5884, partial [Chaetothyriales sp. CBS 134916]
MAHDLLGDSSSDSDDDGGAALPGVDLKDEHDQAEDQSDDESDESTSESEDEGELATEAVDAEMIATIAAIRNRDPKIYDPNTTFYTAIEQARLKKDIVKSMHAAADDSLDGIDDDSFLTAKQKPKTTTATHKPDAVLDVENADKDPDAFLSNFMASRAWAYPDDRNLANEKLRSHARDMASKYSVRREEANPRQRRREAEKAEKETAKQVRKEEKARLRKLRINEVEAKVRRIKRAAGLKNKDIQPEDWQRFKPKKPKFDDDIDIKDLVPDFDDKHDRASLALSEDDEDKESQATLPSTKQNGKKDKAEKRSNAKRDRRIIEALVDDQLKLDLKASAKSSTASFRYRATSPQSFGLTAHDILLAEDAQLNQFVGLKKLAAFRDPEKKKRDKKSLGKKGRLRKWREEAFELPAPPTEAHQQSPESRQVVDSQPSTIDSMNPTQPAQSELRLRGGDEGEDACCGV